MEKIIFQVQGQLIGFQSKINAYKFTFEVDKSQMSGDHLSRFHYLQYKPSHMTVSSHVVEAADIIDLPPIKPVEHGEKTHSQRLRAVFYRLWEQNSEGFKSPDEHYKHYMDKLINFYKDKLE